jgi:hypothetical protein
VTFASPAALRLLGRLDGRAPACGRLVALGAGEVHPDAQPLEAWLDMGGTLDTPERAQAFRARARDAGPGQPAIRHYRQARGGWERLDLTQGEIAERLRAGWLRERACPGDLAYVSDPAVSLAARLALYGFLGDGYTTTALATPGREPDETAELRPTAIVAPPAVLATLVAERDRYRITARGRGRALRDALGGRVRRIGPTGPLDSTLAHRLGAAAAVEPSSV